MSPLSKFPVSTVTLIISSAPLLCEPFNKTNDLMCYKPNSLAIHFDTRDSNKTPPTTRII